LLKDRWLDPKAYVKGYAPMATTRRGYICDPVQHNSYFLSIDGAVNKAVPGIGDREQVKKHIAKVMHSYWPGMYIATWEAIRDMGQEDVDKLIQDSIDLV